LEQSDLNIFLFSEIGIECNGSTLTMLSALARLGCDPWVQASTWARQQRPAAIDAVAACIREMPLNPQSLKIAHRTATRLAALLPESHTTLANGQIISTAREIRLTGFIVVVLALLLGIGLLLDLSLILRPGPSEPATRASQHPTSLIKPTSQ